MNLTPGCRNELAVFPVPGLHSGRSVIRVLSLKCPHVCGLDSQAWQGHGAQGTRLCSSPEKGDSTDPVLTGRAFEVCKGPAWSGPGSPEDGEWCECVVYDSSFGLEELKSGVGTPSQLGHMSCGGSSVMGVHPWAALSQLPGRGRSVSWAQTRSDQGLFLGTSI